MPEKSLAYLATTAPRGVTASASKRKGRSALGVGITTLITVLVVLLLAVFCVLSLASARSDLKLSKMAAQSTADFYVADGTATTWCAGLDSFLVNHQGTSVDWEGVLRAGGYKVAVSPEGELFVQESFTMGSSRKLTVTVSVNSEGMMTIRQWQTVSVVSD